MIQLMIDNKKIQAKPGMTIIEAAKANDIDIPHLCYHPDLSISGGCRLCLVEVEGRPNPIPSCGNQCTQDMVVHTHSPNLSALRREIIDLIVSDHPLDCAICEKAGACLLQKYAYEYHVLKTSHELDISRNLYQDDNPFFIRDHKYCILCSRCVRVCNEIIGADAIEIVGRGFESHVATPFDGPLLNSSCIFCGSCVQVCPTAALMPVSRKGNGREWDLARINSICGYCGVGCQIEYAKSKNEIIYAQAPANAPVNGLFLCSKGRYGWDFINHSDRLTSPLIRKDFAYELGLTEEPWELSTKSPLSINKPDISDSHIEISWSNALDLVAQKLTDTVTEFGSDAVMGLSSARCTNEENYLFQKFFRASIRTNNVDHCARL